MTPLPLQLVGVGKRLAGTEVLRAVSLECPPGQITALLGPNGAGKTTSVAVATGLRAPDQGTVRVFGLDPRQSAARRQLSLIPQEVALPGAVTVRRCLDFVAGQRAPSRYAPSREEICERLGLDALLARRAGGLSGGQQRKVAVALGLLRAPGLLIMDEATTNLDERTRAITWQLVRAYADRGGAALVTSHILADIDAHADRVVALNAGAVVLQSPLAEVRARLGGSSVCVDVPAARRDEAVALIANARLDATLVGPADSPAAESSAADSVGNPGTDSVGIAGTGTVAGPDRECVGGVRCCRRLRALQWRTAAPVRLVALLDRLGPAVTNLRVQPIPLGDVLAELTDRARDR